jgi:hypothetical protein
MPKRLVNYEAMFWRTGRKVGRTIYAMLELDPVDYDPLIGVMDTKALAEAAVRAHNAELQATRAL